VELLHCTDNLKLEDVQGKNLMHLLVVTDCTNFTLTKQAIKSHILYPNHKKKMHYDLLILHFIGREADKRWAFVSGVVLQRL
jgi:plasmid rolling circle replication initiator protein Rep